MRSRFPLAEGLTEHDGGPNPFMPKDGPDGSTEKTKVHIQLRGFEPLLIHAHEAHKLRWEWGRTPSLGDIVGYVRAPEKG